MPAWSLTKNKGDIDRWSLSGANPSSGSKQTHFMVTARAMWDDTDNVIEKYLKMSNTIG